MCFEKNIFTPDSVPLSSYPWSALLFYKESPAEPDSDLAHGQYKSGTLSPPKYFQFVSVSKDVLFSLCQIKLYKDSLVFFVYPRVSIVMEGFWKECQSPYYI